MPCACLAGVVQERGVRVQRRVPGGLLRDIPGLRRHPGRRGQLLPGRGGVPERHLLRRGEAHAPNPKPLWRQSSFSNTCPAIQIPACDDLPIGVQAH